MSKFTQALHKIQENQSVRGSSLSADRQNTLFLSDPVNAKIRSYSDFKRNVSYFRMLRPVIVLALVIMLVLVFFFSVQQGIRIKESLEEHAEAENVLEETLAEAAGLEEILPGGEPGPAQDPAPAANSPDETGSVAPREAPASNEQESAAREKPFRRGNVTIQLITYSTLDRAQKEIGSLREKGFIPFILPAGAYYQVCVNRFENRTQAEEFLSDMQAELQSYQGAYIREIPTG